MAFLLIVSGPNEGDFHPLAKAAVTVGRNEDCTIQVVDAKVSRHHLKVRYDERRHRYLAVDDRSANGVFLNERQIASEALLSNGDVIRIGGSEIIFSEQDFIDRDEALEHYRRHKDDRDTLIG